MSLNMKIVLLIIVSYIVAHIVNYIILDRYTIDTTMQMILVTIAVIILGVLLLISFEV